MFKKPTLRALRGVIAILLAGIALTATAQTTPFTQPRPTPPKVDPRVIPPAGLKWVWMHDTIFDDNLFVTTATEQEKALLKKIWNKEIDAAGFMEDGRRYLSSAVIAMVENQSEKVILTIYNSHNSVCIQPGNGRGTVDMFATCPLRLVRVSEDGKASVQNLNNEFCMLYGDDPSMPRAKYHNEYGFDPISGIVYLRTIQNDKVVPDCNRAIRIFKMK